MLSPQGGTGIPCIDERALCVHDESVSKSKKVVTTKEKKTPGTVAVEKYRPRMNKLTDAEREKLLAHAMVTVYDRPANADRR